MTLENLEDQTAEPNPINELNSIGWRQRLTVGLFSLFFPLFLLVGIASWTLSHPGFFLDAIKQMNTMNMILEGWVNERDSKWKLEIEKEVDVDGLKETRKNLEKALTEAENQYESLSRQRELEVLESELDAIAEESERKDALVEEIKDLKKYQKKHRKLIKQSKKNREAINKEYEELLTDIEKGEDRIEAFLATKQKDELGILVHDLKTLSPKMNEIIYSHIIDQQGRAIIQNQIDYYRGYFNLEKDGTYWQVEDEPFIKEPGFQISLWQIEENRGEVKKRHLFRHILLEIIKEEKAELKNPSIFNLLRFFDNRLAERLSSKQLAGMGMKLKDGYLIKTDRVLQGEAALTKRKQIQYFTFFSLSFWVAIAVVLILLLCLWRAYHNRTPALYRYLSLFFIASTVFFLILYFFSGLMSSVFFEVKIYKPMIEAFGSMIAVYPLLVSLAGFLIFTGLSSRERIIK